MKKKSCVRNSELEQFSPVCVTKLGHKLSPLVSLEIIHDEIHGAKFPKAHSSKSAPPVLSEKNVQNSIHNIDYEWSFKLSP